MIPLIGVATYGRYEKEVNNPAFKEHFCAPALYVDAIRRAGGSVVLLPPGETDFDPWLNALDGVILSGGADVSPDLYGGNSDHPELTQTFLDRDRSELNLTAALLQRQEIPCLFICRGIQVLNVALGGSLVEHIADNGQPDIHRTPGTFWAEQPVDVLGDTLLSRAVGKSSILTMSGHHQGIRRLGSDLIVSATAADGLVEAVEVRGHTFKLGVQWHPEASAATDPDQQAIFSSFVGAAANRMRARS